MSTFKFFNSVIGNRIPRYRAVQLSVDNVAKQSEIKSDYWDWTIFIKVPEEVLEKIEYVEYKLHSTFRNPVRIIHQRGSGPYAFPLSTSGWGTFTVNV